jgi:putative phosphoesterase
MKIVVFSDSHTEVGIMRSVVKSTQPDLIIHLGDHLSDALKLQTFFPDIPMELLKGNNDFSGEYPREKILTVEGKRIFMTHGDRYHVKNGMSRVIEYGIAAGADIILFGHTHLPYSGKRNDVWIMNPGQIYQKASYGVIRIENGKIDCEIVRVK